ncbi:MAG: elongation factor Ts [Firmicutes bacterium]|nr:elongation factor Ts [Bacillota bacterium]
MANVTAQMVKELRDLTGAGIMDCKRALIETDGNVQSAVEVLRKAGLAMAAKKAGRIAAEGLVAFKVADDFKKAVVVEVNSETDFVAKNDLFKDFVANVSAQALATTAKNMDEFKAEPWIEDASKTVGDALVEKVAVIHENLQIRRFEQLVSESYIGSYLHGGGRIAVLVSVTCDNVNDNVKKAVKNVAMQVAALNPLFLDEASIPAEWTAKENEIILGQIAQDPKNANKPQQVQEKMAIGKMKKRLTEVCLMNQEFFLDTEKTVGQYLAAVGKENGTEIKVERFIRFETGEGIEKKQEDFAAEVAKQMNK